MQLDLTLALGYAAVALAAMIPTWIEQRTKGIGGLPSCLAGMVACLLWPLTVTAVVVAVRRGRAVDDLRD